MEQRDETLTAHVRHAHIMQLLTIAMGDDDELVDGEEMFGEP